MHERSAALGQIRNVADTEFAKPSVADLKENPAQDRDLPARVFGRNLGGYSGSLSQFTLDLPPEPALGQFTWIERLNISAECRNLLGLKGRHGFLL